MLSDLWGLGAGESARLRGGLPPGVTGRRLAEMGFVPGVRVVCLQKRRAIAAYALRGAAVALRKGDARFVAVERDEPWA